MKTEHGSNSDAGRIANAGHLGEMLAHLPKWAAYAVIAWQAAVSIQALAGKEVLSSFLVRFQRETSVWELVCWMAAIAGILVALYAIHLLNRQAARDSSRIDALEKRLNAANSAISSSIAPSRDRQSV